MVHLGQVPSRSGELQSVEGGMVSEPGVRASPVMPTALAALTVCAVVPSAAGSGQSGTREARGIPQSSEVELTPSLRGGGF